MRGTGRSQLRKRPKRDRKRSVKVRSYCRRPPVVRAAFEKADKIREGMPF